VPSGENWASNYVSRWIAVVTDAEAVRARPRMYFGRGQSDPGLPAAIARTVAAEPFGWSHEPVDVEVRVDADLTFTVTDDGEVPLDRSGGLPLLDRNGCLLDRRRWALAAAAALSRRTSVEVHACGRRWVQTLDGAAPAGPPRDRGAADGGALTRVTFELDAGFFPPGAALPADTEELWPDAVRGSFAVTDLRTAS
jgi:DNA gyrase/topoisomerase IV subunit B